MVPREPLSNNPYVVMNFLSEVKIFTGITWRSIVFFSVTVAYCTVILCSVMLGCSPFL